MHRAERAAGPAQIAPGGLRHAQVEQHSGLWSAFATEQAHSCQELVLGLDHPAQAEQEEAALPSDESVERRVAGGFATAAGRWMTHRTDQRLRLVEQLEGRPRLTLLGQSVGQRHHDPDAEVVVVGQ